MKTKVLVMLLALIMLSTAADVDAYNVYYGQLHSHTKISDGKGTPLEAYEYARDVAKLDFFSIADHDYWPNDMTDTDWETIKEAANICNDPGDYTTFWGFEWTSDEGGWRPYKDGDGLLGIGHITIINSDDYCICWWDETNHPNDLVEWMSTRDCVAFFNHPGQYDTFFGTVEPFDFNYSDRIVGMELWNRSDDYYSRTIPYPDPPFDSSGNRWYDEALNRGFYIGATGSGDNHSPDWGMQNEWRMAILAPELTRTSLLAAMRARRFYSCRDMNLVLSFTCNGAEMGSLIEVADDLEVVSLDIVIEASDGNDEVFSQIDLLKNGAVLQTWDKEEFDDPNDLKNPSVTLTGEEAVTGEVGDYFYVIAYQMYDNEEENEEESVERWEAISSPIFIIDPDVTPPSPDPMTWKTDPYAVSSSSIAMIATPATDLFSVEYYFDCITVGGHDSDWQDSETYEDTGLDPSTEYTYTVTARDKSAAQNETVASSGASATTDDETTPPTAPSSLSATAISTTEIDLSWTDNASDETGFKIERSKRVNTAFAQIDTVGADVIFYSDTGLKKNTTYYYRVRATNAVNDSAYSNEASATTPKK